MPLDKEMVGHAVYAMMATSFATNKVQSREASQQLAWGYMSHVACAMRELQHAGGAAKYQTY